MEKKRALIKTRIYNYCISYALLTQRKDYAAKPKSRLIAAKRDGGGVGLPGTGSPPFNAFSIVNNYSGAVKLWPTPGVNFFRLFLAPSAAFVSILSNSPGVTR